MSPSILGEPLELLRHSTIDSAIESSRSINDLAAMMTGRTTLAPHGRLGTVADKP